MLWIAVLLIGLASAGHHHHRRKHHKHHGHHNKLISNHNKHGSHSSHSHSESDSASAKHLNYSDRFDSNHNESDLTLSRSMTVVMKLIEEERIECKLRGECPLPNIQSVKKAIRCISGSAVVPNSGIYPCSNIDFLATLTLTDLGSASNADGNDIWGWTNTDNGKMYALTGQTDGMSVVDVSDPSNPSVILFLPSKLTRNVVWRDIKVYNNYAFVVADGTDHGMQYFSLPDGIAAAEKARATGEIGETEIYSLPKSLVGDYSQFGNCHNIVINEATGFAYGVGTSTCSGGLHVVNIEDPANPAYVGCFSSDGYTHDAECIVYNGPDSQYAGREICFAYNENSLTLVDVTDKNNMKMVSRSPYAGSRYTHQGWITADHSYILLDDELDEMYNNHNTWTLIWDITVLASPKLINTYVGPTAAIDHNLYINDGFAFESNYEAGLRILSLADVSNGNLKEVAYFDVYPQSNSPNFNGAWSVYPFYGDKSSFVVVQSIDRGLFVLQPHL